MESPDISSLFSQSFFDFVERNRHEDVMRLRLKKHGDEDFPIDLAITQIEIRNRRIEQKLPSWAVCERVVFPSLLSTEQCSSEVTARYKSRLVVGNTLCDLTGGMGVDCFFMSQQVERAFYIEQQELYCHVARHNFDVLGAKHIDVYNSLCSNFLNGNELSFDTIYIDPARRGKMQERVFALSDCEPDVLSMLSLLISRCKRLIIKMSPMVDIARLRQELSADFDLYILSVRNECKELLAVIDTATCHQQPLSPIDIHCVTFDHRGDCNEHSFTSESESIAVCTIAEAVENYLYEPDVALLKAGLFKTTGERFGMKKMSKNSHLYTSQNWVDSFPGRSFEVIEVIPFSSSICKQFATRYPACNITTRNFPLSPVDLRKKLKVRDGGDIYLMATCDAQDKKILVMCKRINKE